VRLKLCVLISKYKLREKLSVAAPLCKCKKCVAVQGRLEPFGVLRDSCYAFVTHLTARNAPCEILKQRRGIAELQKIFHISWCDSGSELSNREHTQRPVQHSPTPCFCRLCCWDVTLDRWEEFPTFRSTVVPLSSRRGNSWPPPWRWRHVGNSSLYTPLHFIWQLWVVCFTWYFATRVGCRMIWLQ
jgi:hypothetical protein